VANADDGPEADRDHPRDLSDELQADRRKIPLVGLWLDQCKGRFRTGNQA
jgi:hypothetical protein